MMASQIPPSWTPPGAMPLRQDLGEPAFRRVSKRLIPLYLLGHAIGTVIFLAVILVAALLIAFGTDQYWLLVFAVVPVLIFAIMAFVIVRQVKAIGYAEREDDLLIATGIMFRRVTVIPYGRLQYVDVKSGPLERAFGLATLHMHTASASTSAVIPGLPREEAVRLREKLASRAERNLAGL